jgi:hypothetical protein
VALVFILTSVGGITQAAVAQQSPVVGNWKFNTVIVGFPVSGNVTFNPNGTFKVTPIGEDVFSGTYQFQGNTLRMCTSIIDCTDLTISNLTANSFTATGLTGTFSLSRA